MDSALKKVITIECSDNNEKMAVGNLIHKQLRGNEDYINNNIILNIDTDNTVKLWIFKECKEIPQILI